MKRRILCVFCLLLLLLSACTIRKEAPVDSGDGPAASAPAQSKPGGWKTKTTDPPVTEVPASGTDLFVPETLSAEAAASLSLLRDEITAAHCVCAVALMGHASPEQPLEESIVSFSLLDEHDYAAAFPFMAEMTPAQCVNPAFSDLYCLVPGDNVSAVKVSRIAMDDDGEPTDTVDALLYESLGKDPVFLSSQSNGWGGSNILVEIRTEQGREIAFHPAILANLGRLSPAEEVYDFSLYSDLPSDGD